MEAEFAIIGGGFFGTYLALTLRQLDRRASIAVVEREKDILLRASYNNQARIHQGYHYPRHLLTALRSHANFDRFVKDFQECVVDDFEKYYAIGRLQSKVTANQYRTFCRRIGAPIGDAPGSIKALFSKDYIEDVFKTREYAFDADKLRKMMWKRLKAAKIKVLLSTEAWKISPSPKSAKNAGKETLSIELHTRTFPKKVGMLFAKYVFVCTYSNINTVLGRSGIKKIPLKQEFTEMALVRVPRTLEGKAITVMCGPFFSLMPFPPLKLYCLSHVRYTPHTSWDDETSGIDNQKYYEEEKAVRKTSFARMVKDASRYVPELAKLQYAGSIWEVKALLPKSEKDDGRPILFARDVGGVKNLTCVLGGKLDNVYDLKDELEAMLK